MRVPQSYTATIVSMFVTGLSVMAIGQNQIGQEKSPIKNQEPTALIMTIRSDKNLCKTKESITLEVLLRNSSKNPLYLYADLDWGVSASLSLWVRDTISGKDVSQHVIADAQTPPPSSKEAFIKLLPEHIYGVVLKSTLDDLNITQKGSYELRAEYHSPIPSDMGFELPIWGRERGSTLSNRIVIKVEE